MRTAAVAIASLLVAGCLSAGRDGGYLTYDALAQAQRDCAAKGGSLKQKPEGNPRRLDGFFCERK